jgi:hypothetical protein
MFAPILPKPTIPSCISNSSLSLGYRLKTAETKILRQQGTPSPNKYVNQMFQQECLLLIFARVLLIACTSGQPETA